MLLLHHPTPETVSSYLDFIEEMRGCGEKIWEGFCPRDHESHDQFVQRLLRAATHPESGTVPESIYWACIGDRVVGRIALRHRLNENLKEFGGNIGYEVRPAFRRKGLAKEMLRQLLEKPEAKRIGRILLTCAPDNIGSNKTIVANGGQFAGTRFVQRVGRDTNYYWIDLQK